MHAAAHDSPHRAALKDYVRKTFAPTVLVLPTAPAEAITRKSDLSFIDLLRPCSKVDTSSVHVNTTRDAGYRIPELFLHFVADNEVEHKPEEFVEIIVDSVVKSSADEAKRSVSQIRNKEDAAKELADMGSDRNLIPWFTEYRTEFVRGLRFSDHEYFDHPLAVILVAASDEEDVVVKFTSLFARDALPGLYREGVMDPNLLKHYVLLHDNTLDAEAAQKAEATLRLCRDTFGAGACSLIRVNSNQGGRAPVDIWTPCRPHVAGDAPASAPRGALMSQEDRDGVSRFVADFSVSALVPHMDKRIRSLNQAVTAVRKGFKNQFKSWGTSLFGNKSGEAGREGFLEGTEQTGPKYLYNSTEGQIRALADLAFMLHDLDLALSNYKLVQGDYKKDRAWRHVAAASEMAALCHFLLNQDGKRSPQDEFMEAAFSNYSKFNLTRFCARATMLHADMLRARGRFVEAAEKLIRCTASDPNDLRSALLYEQSAVSFLQVEPWGHVRKYALHLVHAGHRFLKAGHKAHGLRCYLSALNVYETRGWTHLDDHLFSALAKHSIGMNLIEEAVQFYVKLLGNQEQKPEERQRIYLRDFLNVIRQHCPDKVVGSLQIPLVHDHLLSVTMSEPSLELFGHKEAEHVFLQPITKDTALTWAHLEEAVCDARRWEARVKQSRSSLQNLRAALPDPAPRNDRCIVVGEDTLITITISNPLQVALELHELSLAYTFSSSPPEQDPTDAKDSATNADFEWGEDGGDLEVEKKEMTILGGQKLVVSLRMKALKEGWVRVRGVRWKLGGVLKCVHEFKLKGRRLNSSLADRTSQHYQRDERLEMRAVPAMPRLALKLHGLPTTALHGEVVRATLEVLNTGSRPVRRLRLACSHPSYFSVGSQKDLDRPYPAELLADAEPAPSALETTAATKWWDDVEYEPASEWEPPVMDLPLGDEAGLAPGGVVMVPLWCRAQRPGAHVFRMLLHYEPPDPDSKMRYRLLGEEASMTVAPSCRASVHVRSCATSVDKLTLAVQVEGAPQQQAETQHLCLRQVSCISSHFVATRLSGGGGGVDRPKLSGRGKTVMYYRLQPPHKKSKNQSGAAGDGRKSMISSFVVGATGKEVELGEAPVGNCLRQWELRRLAAAHAQEVANQTARDAAERGGGEKEGKAAAEARLGKRVGEVGTRIVVVWQTKDGSRMGIVHVACGETDGPARGDQDATVLHHDSVKVDAPAPALSADSSNLAIAKLAINSIVDKQRPCPLQVRLQGPTHVQLPRKGMPCVIPVSVVLWNDDFDRPLAVLFEALPPDSDEATEEAGKVHGSTLMPTGIVHRAWDYEWGGSWRVAITVPARGEGTVPLSASLFRPGVYNLNRFRVSFPSDPFPAQDFHLPSSNFQRLVHVHVEA